MDWGCQGGSSRGRELWERAQSTACYWGRFCRGKGEDERRLARAEIVVSNSTTALLRYCAAAGRRVAGTDWSAKIDKERRELRAACAHNSLALAGDRLPSAAIT
jgi:hypothetical protein